MNGKNLGFRRELCTDFREWMKLLRETDDLGKQLLGVGVDIVEPDEIINCFERWCDYREEHRAELRAALMKRLGEYWGYASVELKGLLALCWQELNDEADDVSQARLLTCLSICREHCVEMSLAADELVAKEQDAVNVSRARAWYGRAAALGDRDSQYHYADLLFMAPEATRKEAVAVLWYAWAAMHGCVEARGRLENWAKEFFEEEDSEDDTEDASVAGAVTDIPNDSAGSSMSGAGVVTDNPDDGATPSAPGAGVVTDIPDDGAVPSAPGVVAASVATDAGIEHRHKRRHRVSADQPAETPAGDVWQDVGGIKVAVSAPPGHDLCVAGDRCLFEENRIRDAVALYDEAMQLGHDEAICRLVDIAVWSYLAGGEHARELNAKFSGLSTKKNDAIACYAFGVYLERYGRNADEYYSRARDLDFVEAHWRLGKLWETRGNERNAVLEYSKAMDSGSLRGKCEYGRCLCYGRGLTEARPNDGFALLKYAADHGCRWGNFYAGQVIESDSRPHAYSQAYRWYYSALQGGPKDAMYMVGKYRVDPRYGMISYAEGIKWLKQALMFAHGKAAYELARVSESVTHDLDAARRYYNMARDYGEQTLAVEEGIRRYRGSIR